MQHFSWLSKVIRYLQVFERYITVNLYKLPMPKNWNNSNYSYKKITITYLQKTVSPPQRI